MGKKRHIDCNWLLKNQEGKYKCCDVRGSMQGKEISKEETLKEACEFCHIEKKIMEDKIINLSPWSYQSDF